MNKVIAFFKRWWILIVLGVAVFSLVAIFFRGQFGQPLTPSPAGQAFPGPSSQFAIQAGTQTNYQIGFDQSAFSAMPTQLPVYPISKFSQTEAADFVAPTINLLGLNGTPNIKPIDQENYLVWQKGENFLTVNQFSGQFEFTGKVKLSSEKNLEASSAAELIKVKLVDEKLIPEETKVGQINGFIFMGNELRPEPDLGQAQVYQIIFQPIKDSFPLIGLGPSQNLVEAKIGNEGTLYSLSYRLHQTGKPLGQFSLKDYQQVVKEIKQGQLKIIQAKNRDGEISSLPSPENISQLTLSDIQLAYLEMKEKQEHLQPIFLTNGTLVLTNQTTYLFQAFLPAIRQ